MKKGNIMKHCRTCTYFIPYWTCTRTLRIWHISVCGHPAHHTSMFYPELPGNGSKRGCGSHAIHTSQINPNK